MTPITRLSPEQRKNVIINAVKSIAMSEGLAQVKHGSVAKRCVVHTSVPTVKRYFPSKQSLWDAAIAADDTGELEKQAALFNNE